MNLSNLKPAQGATHGGKTKIGRGEGSGHGGTATRGNKGAQSNTGYSSKRGHEGGQMPLQRRMPKRGFKNPFRVEYKVFNVGSLDALIEKYSLTEFSMDNLYVNGLINRTDNVKILGTGELKAKIPFKVSKVSGKAREILEAAGSTIELL
jgi:large subunit ribosomal protein L15